MASIAFLAGENFTIDNLQGSGLGFFASGGFGTSVQVGAYQESTFITDGNGSVQGPQVDNVQFLHNNSGSVNGVTYNLLDIPNYLSTLEIRFTHSTVVQTQNAEWRIYDRSDINNNPSGLTCQCAEIIHPSQVASGTLGSGDTSWLNTFGSTVPLPLATNPNVSGNTPDGSQTSTDHSWYVAISPSPDSIGSKTSFGGYFSVEYL